jgi:hypothetical protein
MRPHAAALKALLGRVRDPLATLLSAAGRD